MHDDKGEIFSPWHDVDINNYCGDKDLLPAFIKCSSHNIAHFEVGLKEPNNPLVHQEIFNHIKNQFENSFYKQFPQFNLGFIPQT